MTTTPHTTSDAAPEMLRLATLLQDGAWYKLTYGDMLAVGWALRRQHDLIESLQSELEAVGAGGVQALAASAPKAEPEAYDHGPQATTIDEAARDIGKWLNERPNRPIDLRHVAMLCADRAARRAPSAQDAADWLVDAGVVTDDIDLAQRLNIGHNRAERLFAAARARQKGGEPA